MKKAAEIYKDELNKTYFTICDYQPMLIEFGEIILQIDDADYSGDSRVLYRDNGKYGYLHFGWGSCSGCDALQACDSIEKVQELMNDLFQSIKWFENKSECLNFFLNHDWQGDYSYFLNEQKEFVAKAIELLKD